VETADGVKGAAADGANGAAADGAVTGSGQEEVDFGKVSIKEALGLLNVRRRCAQQGGASPACAWSGMSCH
jgi:hypothetical protein